jgi:hypothetical protein
MALVFLQGLSVFCIDAMDGNSVPRSYPSDSTDRSILSKVQPQPEALACGHSSYDGSYSALTAALVP